MRPLHTAPSVMVFGNDLLEGVYLVWDERKKKQVKSFNTARVVKQMSTLMLKYAIYAFSVEKQLKSILNI